MLVAQGERNNFVGCVQKVRCDAFFRGRNGEKDGTKVRAREVPYHALEQEAMRLKVPCDERSEAKRLAKEEVFGKVRNGERVSSKMGGREERSDETLQILRLLSEELSDGAA